MQTRKIKNKSKKYTKKNKKTKYLKNNFYYYINKKWINKAKIKEDRISINEYNSLQDKVDKQLNNIVVTMRKDKNIDNLYKSYYEIDKNYKITENMVNNIIIKFNLLRKNVKNMEELFAYFTIHRINFPFYWAIQIDSKNTNRHSILLGENGLGLNDKNHYTKLDSSEIRKKYLKYIKKSFELLFGEKNDFNEEDVFKIEKEISTYTRDEIDNRKPELVYNYLTPDEISKLGFNIKKYLTHIGYNKIPNKIVVLNPGYVKKVCKMLKSWTNDKWYSYWMFKIFNSFASYHKIWRKHEFDFYESYLMGQNRMITNAKFATNNGIRLILNTKLTKEYLKIHGNIENIKYCKKLFFKIKEVFRKRLLHNCWLSKETINSALKKLDRMNIHCGLKKKYIKDPDFEYSENNVLQNYFKYRKWYINNQIKKTFSTVDKNEWDRFDSENVFDVNAYYFPLTNEIIIPNGILQDPFINFNKNMAYNLAYLGSTISHEMTHAFDDEGSKYDYNGNFTNWWNDLDKKNYKIKQKSVIKQYENYAKQVDNFKLDGRFSLGENIADIAGLAIAEETLLDYLNECGTDGLSKDIHLKMFFGYYVQQWRTKIKLQAKHELSGTDEHVNPMYRANMSLARSENFKRIFNIQKGDLMFCSDTDQIW